MTGWKSWQHLNFKASVLIYFTKTLGMNFYKAPSSAQRIAFQGQTPWPNTTTEIMQFLVELQCRTSAEQRSLMDITYTQLGKLIEQYQVKQGTWFQKIQCEIKEKSMQTKAKMLA